MQFLVPFESQVKQFDVWTNAADHFIRLYLCSEDPAAAGSEVISEI